MQPCEWVEKQQAVIEKEGEGVEGEDAWLGVVVVVLKLNDDAASRAAESAK